MLLILAFNTSTLGFQLLCTDSIASCAKNQG